MSVSKGTALVRPSDIDAIDSKDLLSSLVSQSIAAVENKNEARERIAWELDEKKKIRKTYRDRAEAAYRQIWTTCKNSNVGHDWRRVDVNGSNIEMCGICSFHMTRESSDMTSNARLKERYAKDMNDTLIDQMTDRMLELDLEAGILIYPTKTEMPSHKLSKKKSFFKKQPEYGKIIT